MSESQETQTHCLNCGASVKGTFCHECGQRVLDNSDRSLSRLLGEFLGNIFFIDNRFLKSIWYLVRYPGRMTVEFLDGKRKKFISPVTLFLFLNLIYFILNPLTDYSLPLYDQLYGQPYSPLVKEWVESKMQERGLDEGAYSPIYQNTSDNISKSIMIINVPIIAFFVYLIAFKKRKFYFDSLIFSFHFFSVFMVSWILLYFKGKFIYLFTNNEDTLISGILFSLLTLFVPLLYAILSIKKFLKIRWYWSVPVGLGVVISVFLTNLIYRFIIFILTVWTT